MTRVNGFKCDNGVCDNVVSSSYHVTYGNARQYDFCSLDCLIAWAQGQKELINSFPARVSAKAQGGFVTQLTNPGFLK